MAASEKSLRECISKLKESELNPRAAEGAMRDLTRILSREKLPLALLQLVADGLAAINPKRAHVYVRRDLEKLTTEAKGKLNSAKSEDDAKKRQPTPSYAPKPSQPIGAKTGQKEDPPKPQRMKI